MWGWVGLVLKAASMFNTDILPMLIALPYSLRARIIEHGAKVSKIPSERNSCEN